MSDKVTMCFTDGRGKKVARVVNQTLDIRDFEGLAGYPWLVIAANPHLSISDIWMFLVMRQNEGLHGVERSRSWIQRHLFLFRRPRVGPCPHPDGKDARAIAIMREFPRLSARNLSKTLKENGIDRSREWVRRHRCDEADTRLPI